MLSTYVRVPVGTDPKPAAVNAILAHAHIKRVHLARPLDVSLTPTTGGVSQLAGVMGLEPDEGYDSYRVDSDTVPCPRS